MKLLKKLAESIAGFYFVIQGMVIYTSFASALSDAVRYNILTYDEAKEIWEVFLNGTDEKI